MALLSSWNKPIITFPPNSLFCEIMCPYCLCNWNWIFCYLGQKPPNWWWRTVKMAVVPHHLLYLWPVQNATLLLLLAGDNFSTPWTWACDCFGQCWKVQSLILKRLYTAGFSLNGILLPPYKEAQASLCRRRKTVESNSLFPATSTEPSNHPGPTNTWVDHRNTVDSAKPTQTRLLAIPAQTAHYRIKN